MLYLNGQTFSSRTGKTSGLPKDRIRAKQASRCETGDLSEGGLLLYIYESMEIGQELRITIFIDSGAELKPVEAMGRAV